MHVRKCIRILTTIERARWKESRVKWTKRHVLEKVREMS